MPRWAAVIAEGPSSARILARPPLPSEAVAEAFDLTIKIDEGGLVVGETEPGQRLPARCPELHIVGGGAFCLGREEHSFGTPAAAADFWKSLGDFLVCQHHAARRRKWPAGRWLSHGHLAADAQLEAEALAARNGWAEDYADALENTEGWIAAAVEAATPSGSSLCPCPLPHLRRGKCPKARAARQLVAIERRRRLAEAEHFELLYLLGVRCCGRIDGCPLEGRDQ